MKNSILSDGDFEYESEDDDIEFGKGSGSNCDQSGSTSDSSSQDTVNKSSLAKRGPSKTPNFSKLIDEFSKLIVQPIEDHLKKLDIKNDLKPQLLIIPQGETFDIYTIFHVAS